MRKANTQMPFGRFKGFPLQYLPDDYLLWVLKACELREPLKTCLHEERRRRFPDQPAEPALTVDLNSMRRKFATRFHPDAGGTTEAMRIVNVIFDELEKVMR